MHFCEAKVLIAGDMRQTVIKHAFDPVSYPEIEVLRAIHGEDAVLDVKPFVSVEQTPKAEKERLSLKYDPALVDAVFPGKVPHMEMEAPKTKLPAQLPLWRNPLDPDPADKGEALPPVLASAETI